MFVVGSIVFTLAAMLNVTEVRRNTELDVEQYKLVITVLYTIGGVLFTVGSAFFHPALKEKMKCTCLEDAGSWLFVVGSMCYFGGALLNIKKIGMEEGAALEGVDQGGTESEGNFLGRLSMTSSAPMDLQRTGSMDRTGSARSDDQLSAISSAGSEAERDSDSEFARNLLACEFWVDSERLLLVLQVVVALGWRRRRAAALLCEIEINDRCQVT